MDGEHSAAAPLVVFASRPNSHPFQARHIYCQDPVKIGRSVARAHPAPANAIFDCKVLSRNHALLWFEDSKFYLQDTKSSNGTFVNNQRLSKGSEESDPHEIFSGDIIQFGVDVMENSKRVTHGCIMASITLYLPDGSEAKPRFSSGTPTSSHSISAAHSQEMYQLSQYLQEALHREHVLQEKMTHLQSLLHSTNDSCESSWHALIKEDRLLSKLEVLQNQLSVFSKNQTEGSLQQQIISMEEERLDYENSSKESLRKVLEEKLAAIQELSDVERSLANVEDECKHLEDLRTKSQQQYTELTEKYEAKVIELAELSQRLQEAAEQREVEIAEYEGARELIQAKLEEALADKDSLQAKVTHLQTQQSDVTNKPAEMRSNGDGDDSRVNGNHLEMEADADSQLAHASSLDSLKLQIEESQVQIEDYQNLANKAKQSLRERDEEIHTLNQNVEQAQLKIVEYVTKVATLEERLKSASDSSAGRVEETTDLLHERIKQINLSHEEIVQKLRVELECMRSTQNHGSESNDMVYQVKDLQDKLELAEIDTGHLRVQIQEIQDKLNTEQNLREQREQEAHRLQDELDQTRKEMETQTHAAVEFQEKSKLLEERLQEMSEQHRLQAGKADEAEQDSAALKEEALHKKKECEALKEECSSLRSKIQAIEEELQRLQQDNSKLDNEVTKTKSHNEELANEIGQLQKSYTELKLLKVSLDTRECSMKENLTDIQKEAELLKGQLEAERREREELLSKYDQSLEELKLSKEQVEQTQVLHSSAQQQLEDLRRQLSTAAENYSQLANKSKTISFSSTVPLMVLVLAVVVALYPLLSRVTSSGS